MMEILSKYINSSEGLKRKFRSKNEKILKKAK
jgi:hypothetical protein